MRRSVLFAVLVVCSFVPLSAAEPLPPAAELPLRKELPDPLVMFDGTPVKTPEQWTTARRPELKRLFQHYMYGFPPPAPEKISATVELTDKQFLGGKATLKLVRIGFGPPGTPEISLLVVVPNERKGPAPAFLGMNFCGNHQVLDDPRIPRPKHETYERCDAGKPNEGRGAQADVWNVPLIVERGYALAALCSSDLDPDKHDFNDGVHATYRKPGAAPGPHDWGTIAAWAFGFHRAMDYLVTDADIDGKRIAAVGHSRLGKTALLAAALDERIALAIPHQAGCGGTAPSRGTVGESVERINTSFPHWFCDEFVKFNKEPGRLPFDQHCLAALCAPRPVLYSNAVEDTWANPAGQFEMLQAASKVYQFLGVEGLAAASQPAPNQLVASRLGYFIRPGKHSMTTDDWKVFLDFADRQWKR